MIVSRRFFSWSDVVIQRWLIRHPSFLVKIVATKGITSEDRLWERARLWSVVPDWPCVGIPITGHGVMREGDKAIEMGRGHIGFISKGRDFRARTEPAAAFGVFLQWDPAVFGAPSPSALTRAPIDAVDLARVAAALEVITAEDVPHEALTANVCELFKVFRSLGIFSSSGAGGGGVFVDHSVLGDLMTPPPPRLHRVGKAIDGVLSKAGTRPMVVDLSQALHCSERQARYLVREYVDAYALQGATEWRTLVNVWTTYLAGLLMTAPGATTERVAGLLGYGSPAAFCHALTNAGLPSPGEMRRIVHDLA